MQTITEVSEQQRLEKAVDVAEAKVADWRRSVATIEEQLHAAGLTLTKAKEDREQYAMGARLGDATAKAAIAHARSETHAAEQDVIDLQIALPEAKAQLASAERDAAGARRAVAKVMAEQLMKKRIEVSGRIDSVITDLLTPLLDEYEKLGGEIVNMPDVVSRSIFGVASNESALGLRRVRAALPKIFDRIYPNAQYDEMKKAPLEKSEAEHWNLPPAEAVKAA
jgi:hypothetical protein